MVEKNILGSHSTRIVSIFLTEHLSQEDELEETTHSLPTSIACENVLCPLAAATSGLSSSSVAS